MFSGWHLGNGELAVFAGLVIAIAALLMRIYPAGRQWCAALLALAVVVAAAAVGGWWLKRLPGAVNPVGGMELGGITLGLAAVALCLPGPARRRVSLVAATVLLCALGVVVAYSQSTADTIVF